MTLSRSLAGHLGRAFGAGALAGIGLTAYAHWEARQYTLRRVSVPVLPAGADPVRVLHLSDIHMTPGQRAKQDWLRGLAALKPDLVINTGDNLAHRDSVPVVADCLGALLDAPGVFVFGSNDYFEPVVKNPLRYLMREDTYRPVADKLPWRNLRKSFTGAGWLDLTNRRESLKVGDLRFAFAGVDDPHLEYDDLRSVAGPADAEADARFAVAHAP
ncbi:MAG: metallophosphoesterase, partial [Nocardioides sp.]